MQIEMNIYDSPLTILCNNRNVSIVKYLVEHGASVNDYDSDVIPLYKYNKIFN